MSDILPHLRRTHEFEGDYRPADPAISPAALDPINARIEPADVAYLMRLTDALNTTLDLQTLLSRTSELVRALIPYRIFAIFLLNDRTHELRMRFQIGHTPQVERTRIPVGKGVVGQVALTRQPILLNDVSTADFYIAANPDVRSELAVPLIAKNRLIGVMDLESEQLDFFRPEHLHLLTLTASRIAQAIENARLYARVSRQAQTLEVLNEIAVELASILDLNPLLERVGQLLRRLIDYQMFTIMLLDEKGETLITRYAWRFGYAHAPMRRIPITSGLVGAAVREWRPINVPDVQQRSALPAHESRDALGADRAALLQGPRHRRARSRTHAPRLLQRRARAHADHAGRADRHRHRERAPLPGRAPPGAPARARHRHGPRGAAAPAADRRARRITHAEMAVRFLPARTIGGDLYDFLDYGPNRTAIVLGDVSGKAAPAALFAALVSGIMRSAAAQQPEPAADARPCSTTLCRSASSIRNTSPCSSRSGTTRTRPCRWPTPAPSSPSSAAPASRITVRAEGFPLGMFPDVTYEEFNVATQPGDAIVFVSDGILDAENEKEEMYGEDRLAGLLCASRELPASEIADAILADVARFQGGKDRFDDETIIVLRVR